MSDPSSHLGGGPRRYELSSGLFGTSIEGPLQGSTWENWAAPGSAGRELPGRRPVRSPV